MQKILFNSGWYYSGLPVYSDYKTASDLTPVDIPHDMLIHDSNNLYKDCTGVYKKEFILDSPKDKHILLCFDGVYPVCEVYLNDELIRSHTYGYSAFYADLSGKLIDGKNTLIVKVDHKAPNSRWYSGAGIFRDVTLFIADDDYIVPDGVYIHTDMRPDGAFEVTVSAEVCGSDDITVLHTITDMDGEYVAECEYPLSEGTGKIIAERPRLWDITSPYLYTMTTEIFRGDELLDFTEEKFGFRTIRFDKDKGFFLNGRHLKINGVCLHHDMGALGAAVNRDAIRRQLVLMKEMGTNAVRTSHNMPARQLMELADELGILINSEAYDMWGRPKTEFDNARFFDSTCEEDVSSWIRRDRNHPSVIMWSIGNEIYDTHDGEFGREEMRRLIKNVRLHDPLKNGYVTFGSNYIPWENTQKCAEELDCVGGNYAENIYGELHEKHPDWCIYGSETAARGQSRGIYHFPLEHTARTYEDLQLSCLENSRSGQGDRTPQWSIIKDRDCEFSAGQFIWTGIDYLGEPTPYSTKNAYYGQCDTAGFKKDSYYLYQAAWTNKTVLHLMPYWDYNDGQTVDVCAYTNAPETELFVNGVSQGRQSVDKLHGDRYWCTWKVPYEKGEIRAVAYDTAGNVIAEDIQRSFGDGKEIIINADRTEIPADGESLIYADISTVDENGVFVANARSRMTVTVSGAGRLIGLDSGDSTDYESYKGTSKKLFSGRLMAIIAAKQTPGDIVMKVTSEGFEDKNIIFKALPCEDIDQGISCISENSDKYNITDSVTIPVRKIELKSSSDGRLDKDNPTAEITAEIFPKNSDGTIKFKAVTDSGIISNIAKTEQDGNKVKVTALGDGSFRLRCIAENGKPCTEVISDIEFTVTGMGSAVMDPYSFISASLYSRADAHLDEVLKGGVRCHKGETVVCFDNVDFGRDRSDEITVPILRWFRDDEMPVEIYDGMAGEEGAELLWSGIYHENFVWQTYLPLKCRLNRPLTGIHSISVRTVTGDEEVNIQGIVCNRIEAAYEKLTVRDAVNLYGDSFEVRDDIIYGIGNNVTVDFGELSFTKGIHKITVCGRTRNPIDSVHIILTSTGGERVEKRFMAEFKQTDDFSEQEFEISCESGEYDLRVMYLPGCNFDLKYILIG
ncbi:MAG: glycoside hydrolase family 2 TIM barrel-domain containing protein [Oscillospiraceae bacterium]